MTNHEQAQAYINKQKLLGKELFRFSLIDYDQVLLYSNNRLYTAEDKEIKIPSFVTHIGYCSFKENNIIEKVTFMNPDIVTNIEESAFERCMRLKEIEIPKNIDQIREFVFAECGIETISIPDNCIEICEDAFIGCKSLKEITIDTHKSKLEFIKYNAFYGCDKLRKIRFPESIKRIDDEAFLDIDEHVIGLAPKEVVKRHGRMLGDLRLYEYGDRMYDKQK